MDATREEIERREEALLAPHALRSARARRARPIDPEGRLFDYRTEYQRDRDRILHARAFRRLRLKADGGALEGADERRDALTHTLEVSQIARTIARALALNEDLAEAVALAHALGFPPFGRDGTAALAAALAAARRSRGPAGRAAFQVNLQSLRVVDLVEKRYEHAGLNLTHDVREGIAKAPPCPGAAPPAGAGGPRAAGAAAARADGIDLGPIDPDGPPHLEAQAVAAADRIAATLGDLDDALRSGALAPADAEALPIVRELLRKVGERYPARSRKKVFMKANVIHRGLTHLLVTSTIQNARRVLDSWIRRERIGGHDAFLAARRRLPPRAVEPGPRILKLFDGLRRALESRLRSGSAAAESETAARRILGGLVEAYHRDPRLLDDYVLLRFKEAAGGAFLRDLPAGALETEVRRRYHGSGVLLGLIVDHVAGMTDAYAHAEYERLFGPAPPAGGARPIP